LLGSILWFLRGLFWFRFAYSTNETLICSVATLRKKMLTQGRSERVGKKNEAPEEILAASSTNRTHNLFWSKDFLLSKQSVCEPLSSGPQSLRSTWLSLRKEEKRLSWTAFSGVHSWDLSRWGSRRSFFRLSYLIEYQSIQKKSRLFPFDAAPLTANWIPPDERKSHWRICCKE